MFAEPTINDFFDNLRWHLAEAMERAGVAIAHIKSEHARRGILQSSMTYQRVFDTVRQEFDAGTKTAFGELKRGVRITKIDRLELRQATLQSLASFAIEAKALIAANKFLGSGETIAANLRSLDQHLSFMTRQFDVGFFDRKSRTFRRSTTQ